jgi:hypothetical protein
MLKVFLFIVLFAVTATSFAQSYFISGYLRDSVTHFPISGGTIKNNTSNKSIRTNERGFFRLAAAPNDLIYAIAPAYAFDTLRYSSMFADTITIFLSPSTPLLPNVTVTAGYTKYQLDSAERSAEFLENRGTKLRTVSRPNSEAFGVGINLDRFFKKRERDKKKYAQLYQKIEEQAYVDYRFSPQLVAFYTGLKEEQLRSFLYQYTPTYKWLRQHPANEDVLFYINEKLKLFKKTEQSKKATPL